MAAAEAAEGREAGIGCTKRSTGGMGGTGRGGGRVAVPVAPLGTQAGAGGNVASGETAATAGAAVTAVDVFPAGCAGGVGGATGGAARGASAGAAVDPAVGAEAGEMAGTAGGEVAGGVVDVASAGAAEAVGAEANDNNSESSVVWASGVETGVGATGARGASRLSRRRSPRLRDEGGGAAGGAGTDWGALGVNITARS